jgi:muramidase (phage lysozyme)
MIGWSEGTRTSQLTKCDGYDVIVTGVDGKPEVFTDWRAHPFAGAREPKVINSTGLRSTASGRYQHLYRYWVLYARMLGLTDFSPAAQDAVAIQQIRERGALPLIDAGDVGLAVTRCSNLWASFPGLGYPGQPQHQLDRLIVAYTAAGGSLRKVQS